MYGLLLEALAEFIKAGYGEEAWELVRRQAGVDLHSFCTHQVYPETMIPRLAAAACEILNVKEQDVFENMGVYFVNFVGQYGYDRVLSVLGRHVRDFLNGLDNLHEYLKFSYPHLRPPSFFCDNETAGGMVLHYRSKRRGFAYYTLGQIKQVARQFYDTELEIELVREHFQRDTVHVTFQLVFDNQAYREEHCCRLVRDEQSLPIRATTLFQLFPFSVAFTSDLVVRNLGQSIVTILPALVGQKISDWFHLLRPLVDFEFSSILQRTNNIFELVSRGPPDLSRAVAEHSLERITDRGCNGAERAREKQGSINGMENGSELTKGPVRTSRVTEDDGSRDQLYHSPTHLSKQRHLHLKGQMKYLKDWKMILFLGTPVMPDLESMVQTGLFINDLSMHDFSRDLMLARTQQSVELKLALDQEQLKSKKLQQSMKKLDEEMRRTDELLYQMIPKEVANRLRQGVSPVETCEVFSSVTVLFSDVVNFTEICSQISPMQVVTILNSMYSVFDRLTERNEVYKVETIGDSYMVVGGLTEHCPQHAERTCDMALDMLDGVKVLDDPSTESHIEIRVGVHSGTVVAGVVGLKMPRYCLFGDTVNTASRMESSSEAMQIHVSETTRGRLGPEYVTLERGGIQLKGKGIMKTFWLSSKTGRAPLSTRLPTEEPSLPTSAPSSSVGYKPLEPENCRPSKTSEAEAFGFPPGSTESVQLQTATEREWRECPDVSGWRRDRHRQSISSLTSSRSAPVKAADLVSYDGSRVSDIKRRRSQGLFPHLSFTAACSAANAEDPVLPQASSEDALSNDDGYVKKEKTRDANCRDGRDDTLLGRDEVFELPGPARVIPTETAVVKTADDSRPDETPRTDPPHKSGRPGTGVSLKTLVDNCRTSVVLAKPRSSVCRLM